MSLDYLFVGDDFTGASDTLGTLARRGRQVRLFLEPPDPKAVSEAGLDAVGVAAELRSMPAEAIVGQLTRMAPRLRELAPRVLHYKVCSTFDSSPDVGSIGAAAGVLDRLLDPVFVAVIGGQPSLGRYCAFGNLFARGADGTVHRIDRHPVMRNHPITPMTEADLTIHLDRQGLAGLQLESRSMIEEGPESLNDRIALHLSRGERLFLFDACEDRHLETVGAVLSRHASVERPALIIGASSVAEAFFPQPAAGPEVRADIAGERGDGPCFVVAGSRSQTTAAQVRAAASYDRIPIVAPDLADGAALDRLAGRCAAGLAAGRNVLAHLDPETDYGTGGADLAGRLASLVQAVLGLQPVPALGIAGGDTSSIIIRELGIESLAFEKTLDPGVSLCVAIAANRERHGMRLMFKGGQVGSESVFERLSSARA